MALNDSFNKNVPYSFNRKEAKTPLGHCLALSNQQGVIS
jgi:hypothetical protein